MATGNEMKISGRISDCSCPIGLQSSSSMLMSRVWIVAPSMIMDGTSRENGSWHSNQELVWGEWIWAQLCVTKIWWGALLLKVHVIELGREIWLETCLLPTVKVGQIVVIDNATFHEGGRIQQLIESAGCQLLYLPPYSPALNKIEKCWSWLKSRIRHQLEKFDSWRDAIEHVLRLAS